MEIEIGKMYIGKIVAGMDAKQRGGYYVHIPDILPHMSETNGLYCKNSIHPYHVTNSDVGVYGSSFPLHTGTTVGVSFSSKDLNSGRIVAIISDTDDKSDFDGRKKTAKGALEDRDEQYLIITTPKYKNTVLINEDSSIEPNTIFVTFNDLRTSLKITEEGILISTKNNQRERVIEDKELQVDQNYNILVSENFSMSVKGNVNIKVDGTCNVESSGNMNLKTASSMNIEGSTVNIKSSGAMNIEGGSANILASSGGAKLTGQTADVKALAAPVMISGSGGVSMSGGSSAASGAGGADSSSPVVPSVPEVEPV